MNGLFDAGCRSPIEPRGSDMGPLTNRASLFKGDAGVLGTLCPALQDQLEDVESNLPAAGTTPLGSEVPASLESAASRLSGPKTVQPGRPGDAADVSEDPRGELGIAGPEGLPELGGCDWPVGMPNDGRPTVATALSKPRAISS